MTHDHLKTFIDSAYEHAAEITDLAARALELGRGDAHDHLARGVDLLNESNKSLRAALATLEGHHVSG